MDEFTLDIFLSPREFSMDITLEQNSFDLEISFGATLQVKPYPDLAYGGSSLIS